MKNLFVLLITLSGLTSSVKVLAQGTDYLRGPTPTKSLNGNEKPKLRKCTYSKAHGMHGADCSDRELTDLPEHLRSNIEILDASYNRIRRIDRILLYPKIRYLYLGENFIVNLRPGTIDKLENLEVLDLSVNSLQEIPKFVFEMSTLRRLYLSNSSFRHEFFNNEFEIKAPLEYIDLAYSEMTQMPRFGIMPYLYHLNISGNNFEKITIDDISPLCRLKILDVTNIGTNQISTCECIQLQNYLADMKVNVLPDIKSICNISRYDISVCPPYSNSTNMNLHNTCLKNIRIREKEQQVKVTWTYIAIGISSFLVGFIAILYMIHRRNVKSMKLEDIKHPLSDATSTLVKE
ncbi:leucine-rich repeat-containing protein 19-like [Chrysoperla carnea]|uniref:leucine-rich repeat-containing protein 19-like n=1 Tax=Chrysoperla carnea TaxID=189513 RepID=UPI001D083F6C|nr:leucine-rich repeat-containing protein 19-like [Chrysoperla carnea]